MVLSRRLPSHILGLVKVTIIVHPDDTKGRSETTRKMGGYERQGNHRQHGETEDIPRAMVSPNIESL